MANGVVETIREMAIAIIRANPDGIATGAVVKETVSRLPKLNSNTIATCVGELYKTAPDEVIKPERGILKPAKKGLAAPAVGAKTEKVPAEHLFYQSFSEWLRDVLDEVTDSRALGGNGFRTKWGTPDIVGVYRSSAADLVKFTSEIVAAEVKTDASQPVVAFGQATAYRLFATKSYVVLPRTTSEEDRTRIESLCMLYGIGLVVFTLDPTKPDYEIRVRAQRFSPDMFYVNEFARSLQASDPTGFEELFG